MKKHIIYLLISGFALLSNMALTSCSDSDVANANDVLMVKCCPAYKSYGRTGCHHHWYGS